MSTDNKALAAVSSAVAPPPTKLELLQAAAQAISEDNKAKNDKRWAADYWGWNWVRRSARLTQESYLEMVRDALKKVGNSQP